jgi:hypothetical protein
MARFAMRGPWRASALAAALLIGSLAIGFLLIPAGAVVALVTLRLGLRQGVRVAVTATLLAVAARLVLGQSGLPMAVLAGLVWLPALMLATVLAARRQQAAPLLAAGALVAIYAIAMRLFVGDVAAYWTRLLGPLFETVASETGTRFTPAQLAFIAGQLHAWSLVALVGLLVSMVLLARYWQAALYNPGGFGAEFRELRLGPSVRVALAVAAAATLLDWLTDLALPVAGDLFLILVVLFAFQGLAVIHFRARVVALAGGWLVTLYVLLALVPQVAGPILALTGLADDHADFRRLRRPLNDDMPR